MLEKIIAIIAREQGIEPSEITKDSTFISLGIDSLEAADIALTLENELGISITELSTETTIEQLAEAA